MKRRMIGHLIHLQGVFLLQLCSRLLSAQSLHGLECSLMEMDTVAVHASCHHLISSDGIRRRSSFAKLMLGRHLAITLHGSVADRLRFGCCCETW